MEMLNRAIGDARDFQGFMEKIAASQNQMAQALLTVRADRDESVQGNPLPLGMQRQPGESRAAHRARLKRERRAKVSA